MAKFILEEELKSKKFLAILGVSLIAFFVVYNAPRNLDQKFSIDPYC